MLPRGIFCAICINAGPVPWLDGETIILIPNAAVVDVNVAASDIKALGWPGSLHAGCGFQPATKALALLETFA